MMLLLKTEACLWCKINVLIIILGDHERSSQSLAWKERDNHWSNERNSKKLQMAERL